MDTSSKEVEFIQKNIKSWENLTKCQIEFERLPGLSNLIYKATAIEPGIQPKAIIYRKFGTATGALNRERENYIFTELAKLKLGPVSYGLSNEFRIEEYYDSETVNRRDIKDSHFRRMLAKDLSKFHAAKITEINQDPFVIKVLREGIFDKDFETKILTTDFTESEKTMLDEITEAVFSKEERDFLMNLLPKSASSIVFSHNDLHSGNILRLKDKGSFLLIDCEYNDYNYRGFDISNYFIETMFDYSYASYPFYQVNEKQYPPEEQFEDFVKYYLFFSMFPEKSDDEDFIEKALKEPSLLDDYIHQSAKSTEFENEMIELLYETEICKMLSHYYWVIWSVIFSKKPEIKFDYISYGLERLRLYKNDKKNFKGKSYVLAKGNKEYQC